MSERLKKLRREYIKAAAAIQAEFPSFAGQCKYRKLIDPGSIERWVCIN